MAQREADLIIHFLKSTVSTSPGLFKSTKLSAFEGQITYHSQAMQLYSIDIRYFINLQKLVKAPTY